MALTLEQIEIRLRDLEARRRAVPRKQTTIVVNPLATDLDDIGAVRTFLECEEISTPDTPTADVVRVYAKDNSGTSALFYKDDGGSEVGPLGAAGGGTHSLSDHTAEPHSQLSDAPADAHHNQSHTVASHSDTSGTGTELNTLTDGSDASSLHTHPGGDATREVLVYPSDFDAAVGDYPVFVRADGETVLFNWHVPPDFSSLNSVDIIMIPDVTETVQADFFVSKSQAGQLHTVDSDTSLDDTLSVTASQLTEWDISGFGTLFSTIAAGDYVGIRLVSNTSDLRILGVRISWEV